MSPYERALIEEAKDKGFREEVKKITLYDYRGKRTPNCNWWQVHDIYMLATTGERKKREYRDS